MKNKEKEVYQRPEMEIILLDGNDIITDSRSTDDDWFPEDGTQS